MGKSTINFMHVRIIQIKLHQIRDSTVKHFKTDVRTRNEAENQQKYSIAETSKQISNI